MVELSEIRITDKVGPLDRNALERCLRAVLDGNNVHDRIHVERILKEEGWLAAAELACIYRQSDALSLKPYQSPPCEIHPDDIRTILARGDDGFGDYSAAQLLKQLFEADLSQYEPNPVAAIGRAKRRNPS
jgi:hypothetical protein